MMPVANRAQFPNAIDTLTGSTKKRRSAQGTEPTILADIYQEEVNIAIWRRQLSISLQNSINEFMTSRKVVQMSTSVTPTSALSNIREYLGNNAPCELSENIAELVDMFCCLFDLSRTGLRLTALDSAMCPRFHVDRVPGRLVTTYQGVATEWLPHQLVDRKKLGSGNEGKPDNQSGLFQKEADIRRLCCGDVAILKGEMWEGNENAGLVHRSPALRAGRSRLLLTLDFGG